MNLESEAHDHDRGLDYDLPRLISRRKALGAIASGVSATALVACGGSGSTSSSSTAVAAPGGPPPGSAPPTAGTPTISDSSDTKDGAIPEETGGPFPGDGSNGPDVLSESGVVRKDITSSFGGSTGAATGIPTTIEMKLLDIAGGGGPLAGAAVYVWHCDRAGQYSMYSSAVADQNYLRGVQSSDKEGKIIFTSIYPACYAGRWPHIHFEVYKDLDAATAGTPKLRTSQMALPKDLSEKVYAADGYEQSVTNLSQVSLDTDPVFSDGYASQVPKWTGDTKKGIGLKLNVGV